MQSPIVEQRTWIRLLISCCLSPWALFHSNTVGPAGNSASPQQYGGDRGSHHRHLAWSNANFVPGPVLKDKPQSTLYLPWRSALGQPGNSSHIGSDGRGIRINREVRVCRRVPVDNVEYIECFETQLHLESFAHGEALEERQIHVVNRWTPISISRKIAESSRRNSERARIEPACDGMHLIGRAAALRNSLLAIGIRICRYRACLKGIGNQIGPQIVVRRA